MADAAVVEEQAEGAEAVDAQEVELPEVEAAQVAAPGGQIDILLDTTMEVAARLGCTSMPAREVIQLGCGSVVTLDRRAGEPVDLLLRGVPFATGRLVVVGEQLGVKIEQILSPDGPEGE
jgi:flagellar motor switch protein FliN/FliY